MTSEVTSESIITLSNLLRKDGMIVSIRSSTTASWFWENYHEDIDEAHLKESLKCIYVKNKEDEVKFDRAYTQVFDTKSKDSYRKYKEKVNKKRKKIEETSENVNVEVQTQDNTQYNENIELIEQRKKSKIINEKLTQDSIVLLDNFDNRVFDICRRLSKKIANQRKKRRKLARSHKIDMQRTIRYNLKNGGHLVKLYTQKPPLKKTKQIFLCDVSGSCKWVSTWFFAILYGCYKTFDKVTIFDFDNKVVDVTGTFNCDFKNTNDINEAHQAYGLKSYGQSDMTKAFKQFEEEANLNNKTDVIILTDCRDWKGEFVNGKLESAAILERIAKKSRRLIILNPEKKIRWNTPTSYVSEYEKAGATVYETGTLEQFANVISKL
ncbi:MAG: VWA domain-containing protein [Methanosphaera sp.]|uniref:VWA domain-containing protein n=1 Tax=Methanosphaera sp. TaxID=2666342 RepID=UPI0025E1501E|nr:VWA domain-containing protein [Methanosphaera sp.]MCI5867333.1 VWA domain-containing protein [Methanosphaera sp.]MDD6534599.1 VWA domain-containing protein [Methanosphaera sp.]MDY3955733.1 VWA domain-containing protein [Methanosphaera sp.]